jgi:hypothetical protein
MNHENAGLQLCWQAFRPAAMGGGTFAGVLLGLAWLALMAVLAID